MLSPCVQRKFGLSTVSQQDQGLSPSSRVPDRNEGLQEPPTSVEATIPRKVVSALTAHTSTLLGLMLVRIPDGRTPLPVVGLVPKPRAEAKAVAREAAVSPGGGAARAPDLRISEILTVSGRSLQCQR